MTVERHPASSGDDKLQIYGVMSREQDDGTHIVSIRTSRGDIPAVLHLYHGSTAAVILVCGAKGGFDGPADGLYRSLGSGLVDQGITSLRLNYRLPNHLDDCVLDTLGGVSLLSSLGCSSIGLVGHSFGGAVVIGAGSLSAHVKTVISLSSQTAGATAAGKLSPRPLLLIHGAEDERLPPECSELIYDWAQEPKHLIIIPGTGHGFKECRETLFVLVKDWLTENLL